MSKVTDTATNLNNVLVILERELATAGWTVYRGPTTGATIATELWVNKNGRYYILSTGLLASKMNSRYLYKSSSSSSVPNFRFGSRWVDAATHGMSVLSIIGCDSFVGTDKYAQAGRTADQTFTGYFNANDGLAVTLLTYGNNATVVLKPSGFNYAIMHFGDIVKADTYTGNGVMMTNFICKRILSVALESQHSSVTPSVPADFGVNVENYPIRYFNVYSTSFLGSMGMERAQAGWETSSYSTYPNEIVSRVGFPDCDSSPFSGEITEQAGTYDQIKVGECITNGGSTPWCADHTGNNDSDYRPPSEGRVSKLGDYVKGDWSGTKWSTSGTQQNYQRAIKDSCFWAVGYLGAGSQYYRSAPVPYYGSLLGVHMGSDKRKMLIPVSWFRLGDNAGTVPDNYRNCYLLGYCEQIRTVSPDNLTPEDTLTYGSEKWLVIPDTIYQERAARLYTSNSYPNIGDIRPWVAVRYE